MFVVSISWKGGRKDGRKEERKPAHDDAMCKMAIIRNISALFSPFCFFYRVQKKSLYFKFSMSL